MTRWQQLWPLALLAVMTTGCGLKGPLTLPTRSDEIVIRGPGQATAEPATTTPTPVSTPARPKDERLPPPPLPGSNSGAP